MLSWLRRLRTAGSEPSATQPAAEFRCSICGQDNRALLSLVSNREGQSCKGCGSSLRMRSLALPEFPRSPNLRGLGMSDWDGYGREQEFDGPVFHGEAEATLEMRLFAEPSLLADLQAAGVEDIRIHAHDEPAFGIIWPIFWAVPVTARKMA